MQTPLDDKTRFNGWLKFIISSLIVLSLSIGGSVLVSSKESGKQEEKISQLEDKVRQQQPDHDLLMKIDTKLDNQNQELKKLRELLVQHIIQK